MKPETPTPLSYQTRDLQRRWPDPKLAILFLEFRSIYQEIVRAQVEQDPRDNSISQAFGVLCERIEESLIPRSEGDENRLNTSNPPQSALRSLLLTVKVSYGPDWLQVIASFLGMIMHLSWSKQRVPRLVNYRRPLRPGSTYPNSPAVARVAADAIVARLFHQRLPAICHRATDAERYAQRALDFRVIDPSMESGQLLLEVASSCIRRVHFHHSPKSKTAQYLTQALLRKLCDDCLWGVDRNALAARSVALIFSLLGAEHKMEQLAPSNLLTADSLIDFNHNLAQFDGIINNPPWGESTHPAERKQLRERFTTIARWLDTYVAFSELGIRSLRPGGVLALIVPSQVIAMRHSGRLRALFLSKIRMDQIILLPRSAFAEATVRAVMILGRAHDAKRTSGTCHVTIFPIEKKIDHTGPIRKFKVSLAELNRIGERSWAPVLHSDSRFRFNAATVKLEQIANVLSGVQVYGKGYGTPPQSAEVVRKRPFTLSNAERGAVPVLRGRDVHSFCVGKPQQFIKFGKWLAWTGKHETLTGTVKIFVRELCRRDGKLTAAISQEGTIPLKGVLTVIADRIHSYALLGLLNSMMAAHYVRQHGASISKVDFQRVTIGELLEMPIPVAAICPSHRRALYLGSSTKREDRLRHRLITVVGRLSVSASLVNGSKEKLQREVDEIVFQMYEVEDNGNA